MKISLLSMTALASLALSLAGCGGNEPAATPVSAKLTFSLMSSSLPAKVETIKVVTQLPDYLRFDNISTVSSPILTGKNDVSVSGRYSAALRQLVFTGAKSDGIRSADFAELSIGLKDSTAPSAADFSLLSVTASGFDGTGSTVDLSALIKPKLTVTFR